MAQENGNDISGNGYNATEVTLTNKATGVINLTGEETTGIYAKRGAIFNEGSISVGKNLLEYIWLKMTVVLQLQLQEQEL